MAFDAAEPCEFAATLIHVGVLDQHRRLQIVSARNQRVVGVEFVLDRGGFEDPLDPQHFLDLVLDRQPILEQQGHVFAELQFAQMLVREHAGAERGAFDCVGFEVVEIGADECSHVFGGHGVRFRRPCAAA